MSEAFISRIVPTNPLLQVHVARWERTLGSELIQRLVFLPFLAHAEMLSVVANCHVVLDTFPWGAGVTAMEALMAGVPVVTLPDRISILPLARGQVRSDCRPFVVAQLLFSALNVDVLSP